MIERIHVAVGTLNQTPFAWEQNEANILCAIEEARARGVSLLCLPELCVTGYGCEDMFQSSDLHRRAWAILERIAAQTQQMIVSLGLPVQLRGAVYNCAALCVDGKIAGVVAKRFLAGDGLHYEPRWFKEWPEGIVATITSSEGEAIPMGDLSFELGGHAGSVLVGFEICEDAWVAARPGAHLAREGVDLILNPSASHFAFGKQDVRRQIVVEGSRAFGVTYLYANLLGNEAGRAIYDGGGIIATAGVPIAEGGRFSFQDVQVIDAIADIDFTRLQRARTASFRPSLDADRVQCAFAFPAIPHVPMREVKITDYSKEEAFARVLSLALFDYLRKSRSRGYVVSLSGGADSSACACLVRLMLDIAIAELGLEGLKERLSHIAEIHDKTDVYSLCNVILTTAYQATSNSGEITRVAAEKVAQAAGAQHFELNVDALVSGYQAMISGAIGRPLSWERDDITLQNIQARTRGPGIWMLANLEGKILLATSNRSEAAVGYATMDGDTCGGISPIAGIDKAFLRRWLRWLEREGLPESGPIAALSYVNDQQPTAELRPPAEGQTDEGDLMPYPLLDAIERLAIRDKKSPLAAFERLRIEHPEIEATQLRAWVVKFYRLWSINQWKRERYAPSFHVDDKNLDPKTWCRFPILSGGYQLELRELMALSLESDAQPGETG